MGSVYMLWVLVTAWLFGPDDNFVNKSVNRVNNSARSECSCGYRTRMKSGAARQGELDDNCTMVDWWLSVFVTPERAGKEPESTIRKPFIG